MPIVERSIWINRPPQNVFDFHADHANRVTWHDHVTRSEMITPPPLGLGSCFEVDTISAGRSVPMTIEITAFDRPGAYSYRSTTTQAIADSQQRFTAENGGTLFQVRIELHFRGLARPFSWFILKFGLEKHFETAVRELKAEMERPAEDVADLKALAERNDEPEISYDELLLDLQTHGKQ